MTVTRRITPPQQRVLDWLIAHGGTGTFADNAITAGDAVLHCVNRDRLALLEYAGRVTFRDGTVKVIAA